MGVGVTYEIPGKHVNPGMKAVNQERQLEYDELVGRMTEAREILDIGLRPCLAEEADFYGAIGADCIAIDPLIALKRQDVWSAIIAKSDFFKSRDYSTDWLYCLSNRDLPGYNPRLKKQVEIDLGKFVASRWLEERSSGKNDG